MGKDLVNNLYRFLKEGVSDEQLFEADSKIKKPECKVFTIEGRVPSDPSTLDDNYIGDLTEKEADGEIPPAKETEENKDTKVEKELEKETPELEDNKALEDQKKGEIKADEGRVPADPSSNNPENKDALREAAPKERELTTMSDEMAAKELAAKYSGGRVVPDAQGNQYIVMVPEGVEEQIEESKKDEKEAADAITKSASSLLRKIHKATEASAVNDIMNEIEKAATKGKINSEQENRLIAAATRRKNDIKDNPEIKAEEPTEAEEQEIEECVSIKEDKDQQQVPKTSVTPDISLPGIATDKTAEADKNAKSQAGSPGKKSVDDQKVPKADVSLDNKTDDVKTHSVPDNDLNPDAKKKVGSPKGAKTQAQAVPKTNAEMPKKTQFSDFTSKVKESEEVDESEKDQQKVPKTEVDQGARVDDVQEVGEGVDVNISTDDKNISVSSADGSTTVVTSDNPVDQVPQVIDEPTDEIPAIEPAEEEIPDEEADDEIIMADEEILDVAERMMLTGHLKTKPKLSDKEKAFIVATESIKLSEKNKGLVEKKLKALKGE